MKVGDKVRITDKKAYYWCSELDLSEITGTVIERFENTRLESVVLVSLEKNGIPFSPYGEYPYDKWNFLAKEIEVIQ